MLARFPEVDVLVNNAGNMIVGPLENQRVERFEEAMATIFWGTVHCSLAVLPRMMARGKGAILNVTSIGGRFTVPHLLPYCCAKAAAVAFSEGMRQEAGPRGVRVLTAVPGLMRTGSFDNALFVGDQPKEYRWFRLSSSLPLLTKPADAAARELLVALAQNKAEHRVTLPAELVARLHGLMPGLVNDLAGFVGQAVLPAPNGHTEPREGAELEAPRWLEAATVLGRRAAETYQLHKTGPA